MTRHRLINLAGLIALTAVIFITSASAAYTYGEK